MKETLIAVHPGYHLDRVGWDDGLEGKYGDYDGYLDGLHKAVASSRDSIVILYEKEDRLPFDVPEDTEVVAYEFEESAEFIEMLRRRGVGSIGLCGEFLWWYGRNVKPEEIRAAAESLPSEKRDIIGDMLDSGEDMDYEKLREQGIDTRPFIDLFYSEDGTDAKGGCVERWAGELEGDFPVRIIRELCYPTKERPALT